MEFVKKSIGTWITAAIVMVIGILCIVAGAQFSNASSGVSDTVNAMSITLGIAFIVVGSLGVILALAGSIFAKKGFASGVGVAGIALAIGIWFVVEKTAFGLIELLLGFVPYVLVVIGGILFIDSTFKLVSAIMEKNIKHALASVIVGYIIAAAAIVLGALCLADVISGGAQLIIFGILVTIYGIFMVLGTFINIPTTVVIVEKETKAE